MLLLLLTALIPLVQASHPAAAVSTAVGQSWACDNGGNSGPIDIGDSTDRNRFLIVAVHMNLLGEAETVSDITWSRFSGDDPDITQTFTRDTTSAFENRLEIWYLYAPFFFAADGVINPAFSANSDARCSVVGFINVNQAIAFVRTGPTTVAGVADNAITTTVASARDRIVYDVLSGSQVETDSCPGTTVGAGQTAQYAVAGRDCLRGSTEAGAAAVTMSWTWEADIWTERMIQFVYDIQQAPESGVGGGDSPPAIVVGGYGTFESLFRLYYSTNPKSFRCANITIEDVRPAAALAILYVWGFGDGTQETTTTGRVKHTYEKEGLYTVTVRVQYRSGAIDTFLINVNARGSQCLFNEFVLNFFPLLLLLIGLMLLATVIVQFSKYRIDRDLKKLLRRLFLSIALLAFAVMAVVAIYMAAMGIPF